MASKRYNTRLQETYRTKNGHLEVYGCWGVYRILIRRTNEWVGDFGSRGKAVAEAKLIATIQKLAFDPKKDVYSIPIGE